MKYYAVKHGREPGIYTDWNECKKQIHQFKGALYKSFPSLEQAKAYMGKESSRVDEEKLEELLEFEVDLREDETILFCDGSYNAKKKVGGFGLVLITPDQIYEEKLAVPQEKLQGTRNFGSELYGAMCGIQLAYKKGYRKIKVYYDYQGIEAFANGDWTPKNPIAQGYVRWMREYQKVMEISFQKVPAHQEIEYNELADKLAKQACGLEKEQERADIA